jgi:hypothetical protein
MQRSTFKVPPMWLDATIPAPVPLLETLSKIVNENSVKGCQRFSLNPWDISKTPPLLAKNRMVVVSHPPYLSSLAPCNFLLFSGMDQNLKGRYLLTLQRFKPNSWWPLTAFPLKILDISSNWNGAGITASCHRESIWRGLTFQNCTIILNKFLTILVILRFPSYSLKCCTSHCSFMFMNAVKTQI